ARKIRVKGHLSALLDLNEVVIDIHQNRNAEGDRKINRHHDRDCPDGLTAQRNNRIIHIEELRVTDCDPERIILDDTDVLTSGGWNHHAERLRENNLSVGIEAPQPDGGGGLNLTAANRLAPGAHD